MKKIKIILILLILTIILPLNVNAADYKIKELIPENIETTVRGERLLYKGIKYNNGKITIEKIRNNFYENQTLTVSIGLFDKSKKNIGTVIYCDEDIVLEPKEEKENYEIVVERKYLDNTRTTNDIKYISVIGENENCRKSGYHDYLGKKVEDIGKINVIEKNEDAEFLINILTVVGIGLGIIFLYKFLFTTKYQNVDNEDLRKYYKKEQKEHLEEKKKEDEIKEKELEIEQFKEEQKEQEEKESHIPDEEQKSIKDYYK